MKINNWISPLLTFVSPTIFSFVFTVTIIAIPLFYLLFQIQQRRYARTDCFVLPLFRKHDEFISSLILHTDSKLEEQ